ncbi:MAG: Asp-tRNA(Asn)/Glu-tRNA(Gln) amidotransferase subunit GatB [Ignavibacteria bacterium]
MNYSDKYEPIIGLEVHAQMKTKSKAFCSCSTEYNAPPNTNVCPVCLGHPGTLPVLNKSLVEYILRLGISTNCKINEKSIFARKNYFYADLPKGYQISQYDKPICYDGWLEISNDNQTKKIGITRIHMEEDAGKLIHDFSSTDTLVDLNRCGIPLIEIVSEPDISSTEEAYQYLLKLKQLVQYLGICDANMEEGSLRCDANVSIRLKGDTKLGTKTEVKNMNSFKNISDALESEIKRQIEILENGGNVIHQTLTYDARTKTTTLMRSKEEAHDYRYFPEPDLVKVYVDEEWRNRVKSELPELPNLRMERLIKEYHISKYLAEVLTQEKSLADYFERFCQSEILKEIKSQDHKRYDLIIKDGANWIAIEIKSYLNENKIKFTDFNYPEDNIAKLMDSTTGGLISVTSAKENFKEMVRTGSDPIKFIYEKNLVQLSEAPEIEKIIKKVLDENPNEVTRYKAGEKKLAGFFVGKIMEESKGKANPKRVNELLEKNLN